MYEPQKELCELFLLMIGRWAKWAPPSVPRQKNQGGGPTDGRRGIRVGRPPRSMENKNGQRKGKKNMGAKPKARAWEEKKPKKGEKALGHRGRGPKKRKKNPGKKKMGGWGRAAGKPRKAAKTRKRVAKNPKKTPPCPEWAECGTKNMEATARQDQKKKDPQSQANKG